MLCYQYSTFPVNPHSRMISLPLLDYRCAFADRHHLGKGCSKACRNASQQLLLRRGVRAVHLDDAYVHR
ncbi:hypothetical protein KCP76_10910 [Salmonella enterica subsp. enterica serovar Weltevreden]|nr:hypothetical protein KCP76_10910 [Salmonella enterica subsp. enterica serovar Weltevreden]